MFNRGYTARANRIIKILAQEEAKRFNADRLLPEHIILAILKENESVAVKTLQDIGIEISELIIEIEDYMEKRDGPIFLGDVMPSLEAQRMIELSTEEAKNMGYSYIGTEHLFLSSMLLNNSIIVQILEDYNVTINKFRDGIVRIIGFGKSMARKENQRKTPILDEFGRDLTSIAKKGKLDKVIGRDLEIERVIQILSRRTKNNPVLIGEPGVGKTAVVEGLAQKIVNNTVPEILIGKRVITLDLGQLIAGTKYRGEFEDRLKKLMKEIKEVSNIILFIDELHTIIGAGAAEGTVDASNMLKPSLSRGEMQCVGATTLNEYKKYIEKDAALERRFQPIIVDEPSVDETIAILNGIKYLYENHHNVFYTDKAIEMAVTLSYRYIQDRFLPDKAIDLIDEAGSRVKLCNSAKPIELIDIEEKIEMLVHKRNQLIKDQLFEDCEEIKEQLYELTKKREHIFLKWQKHNFNDKFIVDENDIAEVVSSISKVPLSKITESETNKLLKMEEEIEKKIIGQNDAIKVIAASVRRARIGLASKNRPIGSFIFLGPTGVGKTELAKKLAEFMFGNLDALVRIDMSDFMEKHNISRLIGAPPGYVGYNEGGLLTEKVRRRPYSVVLLDEIEKAHPDIFNILLQVLEEGELSDNLGHIVSFRNTIIIMTSNVGAREIHRENVLGFSTQEQEMAFKEMKSSAMSELKRVFNPEFLNRVDEIVVFRSLLDDELLKIIDIIFQETQQNIKEHNLSISLSESAKNYIISNNYDKKFGARPLRRLLQKEITDPFTIEILNRRFQNGDNIEVTVKNKKLVFNIKNKKPRKARKRKPSEACVV
ncbi:MAG: ATP-dependent Clp protease ATP-binding subunit [Spirochaetes bacterium]|nr:ATP-dependent Clp protease ATP-binding subunit [Spirochaetota bacterium]